MPPDDPILNQEPAAEPTGTTLPQNSGPAPISTAPSLTRDDVAQMLSGALTPVQQAIQSLAASQTSRPEPLDQSEEDFANEFYKAPKATMARFIQEAARPLIAMQSEAQGQTILNEFKSDVDKKFGDGAYQKFYASKIEPVLEEQKRINPEILLNRAAIQNAFKVVGMDNLDALLAHKEAHGQSLKQSEETTYNQMKERLYGELGNLTGGIRRSDKPMLTEEHRSIIKEMNKATGDQRDENLLAQMMTVGDSIDDFRAAKKKLNGSGKAAN
jgi:hypothetical protein